MNLFVYTMLHFLSKLLWQLCVPSHTHREWVWSYCTGKHNQHGSYNGEHVWSFWFFSMCVVYHLKLCTSGCPAVLPWLHL